MATPQASDFMTDSSKWLKALDAGNKLLQINKSLSTQMEAVKVVTKQAERITEDVEGKADFLISMNRLHLSSEAVLEVGRTLNQVEKTMNKTLKKASKSSGIETIKDCIKQLKSLLAAAKKFSKKHAEFRNHLDEAIKKCRDLIEKSERSQAAKESEASSTRWKGYGGATALGAGAAGAVALGIAGFFSGGAAWVTYGALVAGAAAGGGMATGAKVLMDNTCLDARKLDAEAREFKKAVQSLSDCISELEVLSNSMDSDKQISDQMVSCITDVIEMYRERRRVLEKEELLEKRLREVELREKALAD